jgi:O-antigen ligase
MPLTSPEARPVWSFRLSLVCLVAISASLPMAWISIAKALLFIGSLLYLVANHVKKQRDSVFTGLWTPPVILAILIFCWLSVLGSDVDLNTAALALVKHSKLLEILLLLSLIRTAREARIGISAFAAGQTFLLLSSWLLAAGLPIVWATATGRGSQYVVFSSYLDQSIIFATTAGVFWHLRSDKLWPPWLGGVLAAAALINVFLLLIGRTGYAIAVVLISLAAMWALPKRLRLAALIATPMIVLLVIYLGSAHVQEGLSKMLRESQSYAIQGKDEISSGWDGNSFGWRLNAWHRSVQAIQEDPWSGHGVGSWTKTVKQLEGSFGTITFGTSQINNPHQEFLLWGVELGIGGIVLLLLFMIGILRDATRFETSTARSSVSVLTALFIACQFNSTLYDSLIGDYFCITLGLLMALGLRTKMKVVT